ncbi:hypothetical protein LTR95_011318 [Oleoguttula sp. CCFEE 5521]
MHPSYMYIACLSTLAYCKPLPSRGNDLLTELGLPVVDTGATAYALLYGSPLLAFYQPAKNYLEGPGTNVMGGHNSTETATSHQVVRPNVDTVYASGTYNLSATDLIVTLPPMEDSRFYLFAFYDPFGDIFATLGSVTASAPGEYLLRDTNEACHGTLVPVNTHKLTYPALTLDDFASLSKSTAVSALQLTARLQSRTPPETLFYKAAIPGILAEAGIRDGQYKQPACVNFTLAVTLADAAVKAFTAAPSSYPNFGNGWSCLNTSYSGSFQDSTAIIQRAITAVDLYLGVTAVNALYPTLGSTVTSLSSGEAYRLDFSGKPPVKDAGFWSVTMYDDAEHLVDNTLNTYAVGDRSNITFPNGELVYGAGTDNDTAFQLLVQAADVSPPGNWSANWLPAPSGGGSFTLTCKSATLFRFMTDGPNGDKVRLYGPTAALSDGSYVYPIVTKVKAIEA